MGPYSARIFRERRAMTRFSVHAVMAGNWSSARLSRRVFRPAVRAPTSFHPHYREPQVSKPRADDHWRRIRDETTTREARCPARACGYRWRYDQARWPCGAIFGIDAPESAQSFGIPTPYLCGAMATAHLALEAWSQCRMQGEDKLPSSEILGNCRLGKYDLGAVMVGSGWAIAYRKRVINSQRLRNVLNRRS